MIFRSKAAAETTTSARESIRSAAESRYPLPTGAEITDSFGNLTGLSPFVKAYSLPGQIDSTSARVDHTLSQLIVFFRYGYTPSSVSTRNLSQLNKSLINTSTSVSYTHLRA